MLILYHIAEELCITLLCSLAGFHALVGGRRAGGELRGRARLHAAGFFTLAGSSAIHAGIHALGMETNLLYPTLLAYCYGFLLLITAMAAERTADKTFLAAGGLVLLGFFLPPINHLFPLFDDFRPLIWIGIAYLAGVTCILTIALAHRSNDSSFTRPAVGYLLICLSSAFLFFPAAIGSRAWLIGHLLRPVGFFLVVTGLRTHHLEYFGRSILYRALAAFSLLAAIPFLTFGIVVFYENIAPMEWENERFILFLLLLVTLGCCLVFGLGLIIRLIRPVMDLKDAVDNLAASEWNARIPADGRDEIGELSRAFNQMLVRLRNAVEEQERMCRLAATGELAATLAHEIKNPLNAIGGAAAWLQSNCAGTLPREFLTIIGAEVRRINQLAATLLSFSRPLRPEPETTDCNQLVQATLVLLRPEFEEHAIRLEAGLDPDLPPCTCDPGQVKQVLINLLINAMDACKAGDLVRVTTRRDDGRILLAVSDNGPGIPEAMQREIFNPFFTTKTRGTGLGLAIAKTIAREHSGDLILESQVGVGTTFTLVLPERS